MKAELIETVVIADGDGHDPEAFALAYGRPDFGWRTARRYAQSETPLPVVVEGADIWVFRAWLHHIDPQRFPDAELTQVLALRSPARVRARETVEALLLACEPAQAITETARALGLRPQIVEGYERLFWNVLERRQEATYIASLVYPNTRLVELFKDYLENEPLGRLLLRAGYNNGPEDVLHFAGMLPDRTRMQDPNKLARSLEAVLMGHGYLMARNGMVNQSMRGIEGARGLIAAAKQGGQENSRPLVAEDVGELIWGDLMRSRRENFDARRAPRITLPLPGGSSSA